MALFSKKKEEVAADDTQKSAVVRPAKKSKKSLVKKSGTSIFADMLLAPIVTEKAYTLSEQGKYVFRVHARATKAKVAKAVSDIYGVDVLKVNIMIKKQQNTSFKGIRGTTRSQKKAIVTVAPGEKIDLFE